MDKNNIVDWVYLPVDSEASDLWDFFHDGILVAMKEDRVQRTVGLHFRMPHLQKHHGLPEELVFMFEFAGVTSIRVVTFVHWPGEYRCPPGISREEESQLVSEYQSKGRLESMKWDDLAVAVRRTECEVNNANVVNGPSNYAMRLELGLDGGEQWCAVFIRYESLKVLRSDGILFSLDELMDMGKAYWEGCRTDR